MIFMYIYLFIAITYKFNFIMDNVDRVGFIQFIRWLELALLTILMKDEVLSMNLAYLVLF